MSFKTDTQVLIGGQVITLSGYESEEYMQKVAMYINSKMNEISQQEAYSKLGKEMIGILLALNIADDLLKTKQQLRNLQVELEDKDRQLYDLKHDLVDIQIREDSGLDEKKELEKKILILEQTIEQKDKELNDYINTFE